MVKYQFVYDYFSFDGKCNNNMWAEGVCLGGY